MTTPKPTPLIDRDELIAPTFGNDGLIRHFHVQGEPKTVTPTQLLARLRIAETCQAALGAARADAAALRVRVQELEADVERLLLTIGWYEQEFHADPPSDVVAYMKQLQEE